MLLVDMRWGSLSARRISKTVVQGGITDSAYPLIELTCDCGKVFEMEVYELKAKSKREFRDCGCGIDARKKQEKEEAERQRKAAARQSTGAYYRSARTGELKVITSVTISMSTLSRVSAYADTKRISRSAAMQELLETGLTVMEDLPNPG